MLNSLEERLKTHSTTFDGLLSLIPAKYYYDDATQDQWQQKKQSKKEAQQQKRAKLDPFSKEAADNYNNSHAAAKDVMNNISRNAKPVRLPTRRIVAEIKNNVEDEGSDEEVSEREVGLVSNEEPLEGKKQDKGSNSMENNNDELLPEGPSIVFDDNGNEIEALHHVSQKDAHPKKKLTPEEQQKKQENLNKLREKLSDKIQSMRDQRKAPGSKGAPAKSREQILEERRQKEEIRRQENLKRKREAMEEGQDDSDSESNNDLDEEDENEVLYGNIEFGDGSKVTSNLTRMRSSTEKRKQKGPANNDIKAHLLKLEQKKRRLEHMSPEDREVQKNKAQWNKLLSQAEGIKVKDDEKLLKKALRKKEKQKLKSEIEWKERKQVVKDTISAKQKRREENLKSRKENKGKKSKNQPRLRKFTGIVKKSAGKRRAGFEGSAKSKGKSKK